MRTANIFGLILAAPSAAAGCGRSPVVTSQSVEGNDASIPDAPSHIPDAGSQTSARCRNRQCLVPAGTFMMGSPPDEPGRGRYSEELHEVTLTHDLLYDQYETTQAEWVAAGFPNLAGTKAGSAGGRNCTEPSCPAAMLTWLEAASFANLRSKKNGLPECFELVGCEGAIGVDFNCTGVRPTTASYYDCEGYRLPTMAEFQYAARAGTRTAFYSGPLEVAREDCFPIDHLMASAWYCANSGNTTHPVGLKVPNGFGLFDMLGNVAEFAGSRPDRDTVDMGPTTDPYPTFSDRFEFGIGGGLFSGWPSILRVASQSLSIGAIDPVRTNDAAGGGFRLVRSISREEAARW